MSLRVDTGAVRQHQVHLRAVPTPCSAAAPPAWHIFCLCFVHPFRSRLMRAWWIPAVVLLAACSNDDNNGPGVTPEAPEALSSTSLDGAIALVWTDNPFENDP